MPIRVFAVWLISMLPMLAGADVAAAADTDADRLLHEFQAYSGARLVFRPADLPPGRYHDVLAPLSDHRKLKAAAICLREVKKYPPGYLRKVGLKAVGVFAACVSRTGDGFRPYNTQYGGYLYYGVWNASNGVAAAYYSDQQLPLTFHHEIFHHVDGTYHGRTSYGEHFTSDDATFSAVVSGRLRYRAAAIGAEDLQALSRRSTGQVLRGAVSGYAAKASGEDQAETARHFMATLADSLVQVVEHPELPGSQRILHVLRQYQDAVSDGPNVDWFVDVALGRAPRPPTRPSVPAAAADRLLARLQVFARPDSIDLDGAAGRAEEARKALDALAEMDLAKVPKDKAETLISTAASVTHELISRRIQPTGEAGSFAIWGSEGADGVNWTLRTDVDQFGRDAARLKRIALVGPAQAELLTRAQLKSLRLIARYYAYIASSWPVSPGTREAFDSARQRIADALPAQQVSLSAAVKEAELSELAWRIPADGTPKLLPKPSPASGASRGLHRPGNQYLAKVDTAIADPTVRAAIRRVQPACVRLAGASGVCVSPRGTILTAAHVPDNLGYRLVAEFPDGSRYAAKCTAVSRWLDLAVMEIEGHSDLPFAPLAPEAPEAATPVVIVGQPGQVAPNGVPTGYQPFHVSTGRIRGFQQNRLGPQVLGGTLHDAWTYWGHSGSPLLNTRGQIVALHNSWDSRTAMRHAVTHEAIRYFLQAAKADFEIGQ